MNKPLDHCHEETRFFTFACAISHKKYACICPDLRSADVYILPSSLACIAGQRQCIVHSVVSLLKLLSSIHNFSNSLSLPPPPSPPPPLSLSLFLSLSLSLSLSPYPLSLSLSLSIILISAFQRFSPAFPKHESNLTSIH